MSPFTLLSRYRWHFVSVLAVLLLVLLAVRVWRGPVVSTQAVQRRDIVQTVVATGHVENPHRVDIGASITATVVRVPVQEGQTVRAAQVLIQLESAELLATAQQARMAVAQAEARLRQLTEVQGPVAEQTQRQARANLDNARATMQRNQDLFNQHFIGAAALDDVRKNLELADAQWRASVKQVETTRNGGSDYAVAQTTVDQARANADVAQARARYATITAPSAGVLIARNVEVGDVVQPGKVLMTLSPAGKSQLVVSIDEKNLSLIALGQKALVSADAFPQQKFEAVVAYINPGVNAQTGGVDVKLDIPKSPAQLQQDMTVSVDIEVARQEKALVLPSASVHDLGTSAPWVLQAKDGVAQKVLLQLGLRSGSWVEVRQGLQEGDPVLPATPDLVPGQRVRTEARP
jgi:HlyD family secretion protein